MDLNIKIDDQFGSVNAPVSNQGPTDTPLKDDDSVDQTAEGTTTDTTDSTTPAAPTPPVEPTTPDEPTEVFIDDEGNAVDSNGKVIYEKGTFTYNEETGELVEKGNEIVNKLAQNFRSKGFELKGEDGTPLVFEESEESYEKLALHLAEEQFQATQRAYYEKFPDVEDLIRHLSLGKSPQDFYKEKYQPVDYNKVDFPEADVASRRALIMEYLTTVAGTPETEAKELIEYYEDRGKLHEKYKDSLQGLITAQENRNAAIKQRLQQEQQVQEQQAARTRQQYQDIIMKSGKLNSVVIPEGRRQQFFEYIFKDTGDGVSQMQKDYAQMTPEQILEIQYLIFNKLEVDELVKIRQRQEQADLLKKRKSGGYVVSKRQEIVKAGGGTPDVNVNNIQ